MEDLSSRTAQEVLDDHLNLAENWGGEGGFERGLLRVFGCPFVGYNDV